MADEDKRAADRVTRLRRLDCCGVSDALDRLKLGGVAKTIASQSVQRRIAGRAVTVKLGMGTPPPGPARHLGTTAIEAAGPDDVIVVQQANPEIVAGSWGGLLTLGAIMRKVAGVVSDGLVRDIDEAVAHEFPVYARGCTAVTARGRIVELGTNVDIEAGGVPVSPGDYVIADRSAVIFISADTIDAVLDEAEKIVAREADMARVLLKGVPISRVMSGDYERMLEQ